MSTDREKEDVYTNNSGRQMDGLPMRERLVEDALERTYEEHPGISEKECLDTYLQNHDEYLVDGARLTCSSAYPFTMTIGVKTFSPQGADMETKLKVTENPKAGCCELNHATVRDCVQGKNIEPFRCNCMMFPSNAREWDKVMNDEVCLTEGTCRALMDLESQWENFGVDDKYFSYVDDEYGNIAGINTTSMLFCKHGGLITPVDSGQIQTALDETESYIKLIMETLGWNTDAEEVKELHAILNDFGITDKNSIACFFLICISESGKVGTYVGKTDRNGDPIADEWGRAVVEDYPKGREKKVKYKFEERDVTYMHITGKISQLACLKDLKEKNIMMRMKSMMMQKGM